MKTDTGSIEQGAQWFVVKSQTKREHIAASILANAEGVEAFCPRIRYRKATRRGKVWWVEPLFPSYFFAKFNYESHSRLVASSHGISQIVSFGGRVPHISEVILEEVRRQTRVYSVDDIIEVEQVVCRGDEVEFSTGPFKGVKGVVQAPKSAKERVEIMVEFLGQEQVVEVDLLSLILPRRLQPTRPARELLEKESKC